MTSFFSHSQLHQLHSRSVGGLQAVVNIARGKEWLYRLKIACSRPLKFPGHARTQTHARTHTHTHTRTHARTHASTHARTHTHTHCLLNMGTLSSLKNIGNQTSVCLHSDRAYHFGTGSAVGGDSWRRQFGEGARAKMWHWSAILPINTSRGSLEVELRSYDVLTAARWGYENAQLVRIHGTNRVWLSGAGRCRVPSLGTVCRGLARRGLSELYKNGNTGTMSRGKDVMEVTLVTGALNSMCIFPSTPYPRAKIK